MKGKLLLTALTGVTMLVGGCAVVPVDDPYYNAPVVRVAPPPPRYEYVGTPPVVGYIWIGGYWNWVGARYIWVPGRWEAPRPGYYWAPHRWERQGEHWRSHGGRWERGDRPHVVVSPAPPPRIEHRAPPTPVPYSAPPPRYEQRPMPQVAPPPPVRQEPPPRPPHMERNDRGVQQHEERREERRDERRKRYEDRDGDGRPDSR